MKVIYSVLNSPVTKFVQERIAGGARGFRSRWGLYGTTEWFTNLKRDGQLEVINGEITKLFMAGHNDFPMFEVYSGEQRYEFERLGEEKLYIVGTTVELTCTRSKNIFPSSGFEESLRLLVVEIQE